LKRASSRGIGCLGQLGGVGFGGDRVQTNLSSLKPLGKVPHVNLFYDAHEPNLVDTHRFGRVPQPGCDAGKIAPSIVSVQISRKRAEQWRGELSSKRITADNRRPSGFAKTCEAHAEQEAEQTAEDHVRKQSGRIGMPRQRSRTDYLGLRPQSGRRKKIDAFRLEHPSLLHKEVAQPGRNAERLQGIT
jgi:hypothetical protein